MSEHTASGLLDPAAENHHLFSSAGTMGYMLATLKYQGLLNSNYKKAGPCLSPIWST